MSDEKFQVQLIVSLDFVTGESKVIALYRKYKDATRHLRRLARKQGALWDSANKQIIKGNTAVFITQRTVR